MATSRGKKLEDWAVSKGMPRPNAEGFVRGMEGLANGLQADAGGNLEAAWNASIPEVVRALAVTMAIDVDRSEMIGVFAECGYISEELRSALLGIIEPAGDA